MTTSRNVQKAEAGEAGDLHARRAHGLELRLRPRELRLGAPARGVGLSPVRARDSVTVRGGRARQRWGARPAAACFPRKHRDGLGRWAARRAKGREAGAGEAHEIGATVAERVGGRVLGKGGGRASRRRASISRSAANESSASPSAAAVACAPPRASARGALRFCVGQRTHGPAPPVRNGRNHPRLRSQQAAGRGSFAAGGEGWGRHLELIDLALLGHGPRRSNDHDRLRQDLPILDLRRQRAVTGAGDGSR
jgi:hypothetical protein